MQRSLNSALVSTKWLRYALELKSGNHKIVDASWLFPSVKRNAEEEYKLQHIPGARYFNFAECSDKSSPTPFMLPPPKIFESYVGNLGINNDNHVILYDNHPQFPFFTAQRVWWTFRVFGHERVSILDGGLKKWKAENGPVTSDEEEFDPEKYHAKIQPQLVKHYTDIFNNIKDPVFQLVDARPVDRFSGTGPEPIPGLRPGNIPNTVNIPLTSAMDLENHCLKSPEELKKMFADQGIDLNKPLVTTCTIGVTANVLTLAAYECGNDNVAVYDGSWSEWYYKAPDDLKKDVPSDEVFKTF